MCCRPHPSLILFGTTALRSPVKLGVWNIRISTRSCPNSSTKGASREAHDGSGVSLVPRNASVRIESFTALFALRASRKVSIWNCQLLDHIDKVALRTSSCSVLPMYNVDMKIFPFAFRILLCSNIRQHQKEPKCFTYFQNIVKLCRALKYLDSIRIDFNSWRYFIQVRRDYA